MITRRTQLVLALIMAAMTVTTTASAAVADGSDSQGKPSILRESLTGYEEVPLALSTTGNGEFRARIDDARQEISYELSYAALEGTVTQAHIHFGSKSQAGGISVFLCSNLGNGPVGTQACPAAPATISGTIRPADVIGPAAQGITAGQFAELVAAIRADTAYVNVHSTLYPGGEIRGQIEHHH
jgi:CHRD domain